VNSASVRNRLIAEGAPEPKVYQFIRWHSEHRDVWESFEQFSLAAAGAGRRHYGAMAILNRVRWHAEIEKRSDDFKVNNNWAPYYARIFVWKYPELSDLFSTKKLGGREYGDEPSNER
jgi:hypothetical protein